MSNSIVRPLGRYALTAVISMMFSIIFYSCSQKNKLISIDPAFGQYIDGYTSGTISKKASIKIQLSAQTATSHALGDVADKSLITFSPAVNGKSHWIDARTIEFIPDANLKPDQLYKITFQLGKVTHIPSKYNEFIFNVKTIKPSFSVKDLGLRSDGTKDQMLLPGILETADFENDADVEKLINISMKENPIKITWQHNGNTKTHNFTAQPIARTSTTQTLSLQWNGSPMNIDIKGNKTLEVPAIGDFKVLNVMAMNDDDQYASVQFSDPILPSQDLTGLLSISEQPAVSFSINGSEIKLYTDEKLDGNYTVNVNAGIKNTFDKTLDRPFTSNVFFENRMPSVTIQGRGNILPNSGKLVLPFEAVNLSAVDVSILKIYENNIPQFLQNNNLEGGEELRRVAKPIVQKTLRLDNDNTLDLHKKQRFSLDIDQFLKTEPGAIYRVTIGFRPQYSLYDCKSIDSSSNTEDEENYSYTNEESPDENSDFWNRYDQYYPYGYDWDHRNNPCYNSYYNKDRWASRNILASNIGLTAKRGSGNKLTIVVTDILTTNPLADVQLKVLNYQMQEIATVNSDREGIAAVELPEKPFLLIAKKEKEKGYLKIDDGSSLPLSRFDISGEEVSKGIKAFISGERGVWRPGDSIYLSCIVQDKDNKLPPNHPLTLELYTPRGQVFQKLVQNNTNEGFNVFRIATSTNSPTGNWLAKIKIGGATFEKRIRVETVMPNRLKIDMDFNNDSMLGKNIPKEISLSARWLFGATAKNLTAKIDANLYANTPTFAKFTGYTFYDPTTNYSAQTKNIFDGKLNDEGKATVKTNFEDNGTAPGMLTANLFIKVFEPGGAFSINSVSVPYSPYTSYAGIKVPEGEKPWGFLVTGKSHTAQIVDVDRKGSLIAGNKQVEVQFYKIQWRWWWDNSGNSLSNFTQDKFNKLIKTEKINLTDGRGSYSFSAASNEWGRYLILVKDLQSGHTTGSIVYLDEPGWQSRNNMDDPTAASMLSFTSDKNKYQVGDDITLTIPSSKGGRGLISLETGSQVLRTIWVDTKEGETIVKFKAEKEMAPNIYANVSLLQPHAQTMNDLPIRMYGVIPIMVEDKNTILKPAISIQGTIRPEVRTSVTVSEQSGKEMNYSIALVDDGLLDLTNFKTPDPHNYFYAREALGVKSWDLFDYVIGAWGANIERILTIGGDQQAGGPVQQKQANRFKPIVQFLGPFHLKKGDKQTTSFTLPQYIGSIRVMVVAAGDNTFGNAEKTVLVKKPLMLLSTVPRVLGPGETVRIPVTVFAMEKNIHDVKINLLSNNLFEASGPTSQQVSFSEPGEKMIFFDIKVKTGEGIGKIVFQAVAGSEQAKDEVELNVRNPNPAITNITAQQINGGGKWNTAINPIGTPQSASAMLEISSIPAMDLQKRLDYLIDYPHGCVEQITSGVFPQLVLNQLTDLSDARKAKIDRNVKAGIASLFNFQANDGGFSYWPGIGSSDEWGSNYAGHFLLAARQHGYTVSESMISQWRNFEKTKANAWAPSTTNFYGADITQAYRLYLLALAKSPELGAMNRLKEFKYLSPQARWNLAAAYKLAGQDQTALQIISSLPTTFNTTNKGGISYGSDTRDEAMVLQTLTLMGKRNEASQLVTTLAYKLASDEWYSTQTTAYALIAIADYCGKNISTNKILATARINNQQIAINSPSYIYQLPIDIQKGSASINLNNNGQNVLYVRVINRGQPLTGENIKVENNPAVLAMTVSYLNRNMQAIDVAHLQQGTDFIAKVSIKNPGGRGYYERMALTQIFPSGWEIINTRLQEGEGSWKNSPSEYQDVRDDRVYTYFGLGQNETVTYYVQLNAAYLGKYFLPGTYCTAMYDHTINAGTKGQWVEVKKE
ncbi:MAG: hypothetical protein JSS98_01635 [Bacteroidetes bacterium]|nr:hypothetical protein [Bacteroidota bacterium]